MSPPGFTAAAILMVLLAGAHSVLGERFIIARLMRRAQPELFGDDAFTKQTLRFAWHVTTIAWFALATALLLIPSPALGWIVVASLAATSIMTVAVTRGKHLSWVVELAAVAALLTDLLGSG